MRSQGDPEVDPLRGSRDSAARNADQLLGLENAAWMIGLGRMGGNMVRRLAKAGHECVVYDRAADAVDALAGEGAVAALRQPRPSTFAGRVPPIRARAAGRRGGHRKACPPTCWLPPSLPVSAHGARPSSRTACSRHAVSPSAVTSSSSTYEGRTIRRWCCSGSPAIWPSRRSFQLCRR